MLRLTKERIHGMNTQNDYLLAFKGSFTSALRWHQLDDLWQVLNQDAAGGWYIYAVGEAPPHQPVDGEGLSRFVTGIDELLRREHDEKYCGIVYADDLKSPAFIKIYDPNNLGVSCGYSDNPPLPGWVLSKIPPVDLMALKPPNNRKRWWQALWG
jgi:hypothetical protein